MSRNLRKGSGGAKAGVNIQGGQIENTPIGKAAARSAVFGSTVASSLSVSGATNLVGGSTLPAGSVLAGATFRNSSQGASASGQTGVLTLSVDAKTAFVPLYSSSAPSVGGGGKVVQFKSDALTAAATSTDQIPSDNSIPQITEGAEVLSLTITPTNAANLLLVECNGLINSDSALNTAVLALFRSDSTDAIGVGGHEASTGDVDSIMVRARSTAGVTTELTISVRLGTTSGLSPTVTLGGDGGGRLFGATEHTVLTVVEIEV